MRALAVSWRSALLFLAGCSASATPTGPAVAPDAGAAGADRPSIAPTAAKQPLPPGVCFDPQSGREPEVPCPAGQICMGLREGYRCIDRSANACEILNCPTDTLCGIAASIPPFASCAPITSPLIEIPLGVTCAYPTDCPAGQHCVDFGQVAASLGQRCIPAPDGGDDCSAIRCLAGQRCVEHGMNPGVLTCEGL